MLPAPHSNFNVDKGPLIIDLLNCFCPCQVCMQRHFNYVPRGYLFGLYPVIIDIDKWKRLLYKQYTKKGLGRIAIHQFCFVTDHIYIYIKSYIA